MKDRVPLYPGRVKLTPVSGQANTYDMVRADEPTQEGTQLSKATFLKDATAALFGLGADAVPDDVLAKLGVYTQYWWRRRINTSGYVPVLSSVISSSSSNYDSWIFSEADARYSDTISYSSEIIVSSSGDITLKNPSTVSISYNTASNVNILKGKYVKKQLRNTNRIVVVTQYVYIPPDATYSKDTVSSATVNGSNGSISFGSVYLIRMKTQLVTTKWSTNIGEWEYLQSNSRDAYPDSGITGNYEYQYLGVPFENAVTAAQFATGSYIGTGKNGASNPNRLTFDFIPKYIAIYYIGTDYGATPIKTELMQGMYGVFNEDSVFGVTYYDGDNANVGVISEWGTTVKFYADYSHQPNKAGVTYKYFAIG